MALDRQIHVYSFDTSAFYTDEERELEKQINSLSYEKNDLKAERDTLIQFASGNLSEEKAKAQIRAIQRKNKSEEIILGGQPRIDVIGRSLKEINQKVKANKDELRCKVNLHDGIRTLRTEYVVDKNIISIFESMLTRTLGMKTGELSEDIIVIRTYYFDVIRDLITNGFTYNGEHYICFTASAGQIRTKKTVFIKQSVWEKYRLTLMCGLTVEDINAKGGININKYLAYLALCNSATDPWPEFDIDKAIVVDDFETLVHGTVDYIDHHTYKIERREMDVPITHTDGAGLILPRCSRKNFMVRLPWVKGLLACFPFDKFVREANRADGTINHGIVKDIYGVEHDILAEDIQVFFCKSQFKMWKYYDSWESYKAHYKLYGCTAGKCNEEDDFIGNAKLNYQMLQTLTDMTDEELSALALKTADKIKNIATSRETMLDAFSAAEWNQKRNDYQNCLMLYPELLHDPYCKERLKAIKDSIVQQARAGKLYINGKYAFLIPDLYAFCEWLFLGDKNPKGLLQDGEVSCRLYKDVEKLDCLRSPHLYREHAVRRNVINDEIKRWFTPKAIYTSCHDLISKILQFDVDGDKSLVISDPLLISIAERNMDGIVPLYYEMAKAGAVQISAQAIYNGMISAWRYGNIGKVSNDITKLWNSDNPDIDLIKILTCENNFTIDAAKTLYMPERPAEIDVKVTQATKVKVPHFFIYAKERANEKTAPLNNSAVNRLEAIIKNPRITYSARNIGKFDYRYMTAAYRQKIEVDAAVTDLYDTINKEYGSYTFFDEDDANTWYIKGKTLAQFAALGYTQLEICDMLIVYLFKVKTNKRKNLFWLCYGDMVLVNLQNNLPSDSKICEKCGSRFRSETTQRNLCDKCNTYQRKGKKTLHCVDCGASFEVDARNMKKIRCDACQKEHAKELRREAKRNRAA